VLARKLAVRGRAHAERHFAWPVLMDRNGAFLERSAERAARRRSGPLTDGGR
jgi:hypothetical protein